MGHLTVPRGEASDQLPVGIENIRNAQAFASDIILFILILLGIGHIEVAIDVANAERRKTSREEWVAKRTWRRSRREILVEDIDLAIVKICGIEEITSPIGCNTRPL